MQILEIILKCIGIYFVVLIALKFMGKREIGQLSLFDFAIILIMADILVISVDSTTFPFYYFIIPIFMLSIIQKIIAFILLKSKNLRNLFDGKSSNIIINGKLNIKEMRKQNYNLDDLLNQTRLMGIASLSEIKHLILETNGRISIFKFEDCLTDPFPVIISGQIVKENLAILQKREEEIMKILNNKKEDIKNIKYAIFEKNDLFIMPTCCNENNNKK